MQPTNSCQQKNRLCCFLAFGLPLIGGVFLRLYLIQDQILLDDEWHSLFAALTHPFSYILTHLHQTASSIPLNVYAKLTLLSTGWNELIIRLPSLASGIGALCLFPHLIKKLLDKQTAMHFSWLLAISPFLIFYTRHARPYSLYALLAFTAILTLTLWALQGCKKYAALFIATAVTAVYVHPFALFFVLTLFIYTGIIKAGQPQVILPSLKSLVLLSLLTLALILCLFAPVIITSFPQLFRHMIQTSPVALETLFHAQTLLCGTANPMVMTAFFFFLGWGIIHGWTQNRFLTGLFLSLWIGYALSIACLQSTGMSNPQQIARYGIPLLPLTLAFVALGLSASRRFKIVPPLFILLLFLTGPLTKIYSQVNSFTNHAAYHESYLYPEVDPYTSAVLPITKMREETLPSFYRILAQTRDDFSIIEYPLPIGDPFNLLYYYQRFHHKRVLAGYVDDLMIPLPPPNSILHGNNLADEVFSLGNSYAAQFHFRNFVQVKNITALRRSKARFIILHKYLFREIQLKSYTPRQPATVYALIDLYTAEFGRPVYEDQWLVVFSIQN